MKRAIFLILLFVFTFFIIAEEKLIVRIPVTQGTIDTRPGYFIDFIKIALENTIKEYGDYQIQYSSTDMVQERALNKIKYNTGIDLYWVMTSVEREENFLPIRIPLIKGLLGHRLCIIRREDESKFNDIKTLDQLKKLVLVQGTDWPDSIILEENGFNVYRMSVYESMFKMVQSGRVDFFPRGVNEPFEEVRVRPELDLIVEKNLLIQYVAPMYFFVNKENELLAERIEKGLIIAIEDGTFDKHFYGHSTTKAIFEQADIENRTIFKIDNPILPPLTPIDDKQLWYTP